MDVFKTLLLDTPDSLTNITGVLPVVNGGTGASTASGARTNLGLGTSAVLDAGAANGVATLGNDSKLTTSQLPDIAVVDYLGSVANEAAMLALTGQKGDWCTRSDLGTNWIITGSTPSSLASWTQLSYPTAPVTSVAGKTGAVTLTSSDVGLGNVTNHAQTQASIVPNTAPSAGQLLVGNAGGTAYAPVSASGDLTVASTGACTLATVNSNVGSFGSATQSLTATVNGKGLITAVSAQTVTPAVGSITGLGTGVATALAVNVGTAGAPVVNGGALGTPTSGTVTNLTGTASININGTVGATTPSTGAFTTLSASSDFELLTSGSQKATLGCHPSNGGLYLTPNSQSDIGQFRFYQNVANVLELHIRPNNGKKGYITFTESGYSDKWAIGTDNGSNNLYFRINDTSGAAKATLSSTGLTITGDLSCTGALSKGSGSFRIDHPLPEKRATHQLVHSFIEGPKADLIYRGKVNLVDGKASVNIDTAATMTEGTFEVLCRDVQCFTTNESGWTAVRGKVTGNILTIEAQDAACTDSISWMVVGERQDQHMMDTEWTDDNGRVIVEPLKPATAQLANN